MDKEDFETYSKYVKERKEIDPEWYKEQSTRGTQIASALLTILEEDQIDPLIACGVVFSAGIKIAQSVKMSKNNFSDILKGVLETYYELL